MSNVEWDNDQRRYLPVAAEIEPAVAPVEVLRPTKAARSKAAVTAAGKRIPIGDQKSLVVFKRKQRWQQDAWDCYDTIPEVKNAMMQVGNLLSRIRLFPGWLENDDEQPLRLDDETLSIPNDLMQVATETLHRLASSLAGIPGIMKSYGQNWAIVGECYICKMAPGEGPQRDVNHEMWWIKSVDELVTHEGKLYALETAKQKPQDGELVEESRGDYVARLWQMHPHFAQDADSNMMAIIDLCEELQLLSQEARARIRSRMSAGMLTMPTEVSYGGADKTRSEGGGESGTDPFDEDLQEIIIAPIEDEGHPSAVAPVVLRGPAEFLKPEFIRWITFHRTEDDGLDTRREALARRVARGLPLPIESVLGHQETTFANAEQVSIDEYRAYIEPLVLMMVWSLTTGFYRPFLEEAGVDEETREKLVVWYDPSEIVTPPDQTDDALKLHEQYGISFAALRRAGNFTEADAPTDEEIALRILLQRSQVDPALAADLIRTLLGVDVTSGQEIDAPRPVDNAEGTGPDTGE